MSRELVAGEQSVEHRRGDQVLREHRDRVIAADRVIEVVLQPLVELRERLSHRGVGPVNQDLDPSDQGSGDIGDVLGPVLPVGAGTDLVDDAGVDRLLPLRQREQRHLRRQPPAVESVPVRNSGSRVRIGVATAGGAGALTVADALRVLRRRADVPTEKLIGTLPGGLQFRRGIQRDRVDHRVEAVVVGAQSVEDLPHHLESAIVRQRL